MISVCNERIEGAAAQIAVRVAGNASVAEKLRKFRFLADRITESELDRICKLCETHRRSWGPTLLLELSRIVPS